MFNPEDAEMASDDAGVHEVPKEIYEKFHQHDPEKPQLEQLYDVGFLRKITQKVGFAEAKDIIHRSQECDEDLNLITFETSRSSTCVRNVLMRNKEEADYPELLLNDADEK